MNKTLALTVLAAALAAAFPAQAQSNAEVLEELKRLRERIGELEKKLQAAEAKPAQPAGMTPEQTRELNRVAVKTEALEDSRDALGFKGLKISGYMDPTFIYNKNQNRAGAQFLNSVGNDGYNYDNSYFGAAVIDFVKETDSGTRWRLTLAPNRGVGSVFDPDSRSPIHEASVSVPLGSLQTRFIAGQLPDWSGYEYLQPTLNKLITHNLLFDFTLPTAYTGAGFEISDGKWIYKAMLGNMNTSKKQAGEKTPMVAYRVDYARGEFQGFGFAGVHGKAANFNDGRDSRVDLFEVDAYFIRGDVTLQGQLSVGKQKGASITPDPTTGALRDASWTGLSVLGAYKFTPRFEGTARYDMIRNRKNGGGLLGYTGYLDDNGNPLYTDSRNGIGVDPTLGCEADLTLDGCSRGVTRSALTFGLSYLYDLNTTFKFEYRIDRANAPVFLVVKDNSYKKTNQLFGASVLVSF